jgi:hypothetical protein
MKWTRWQVSISKEVVDQYGGIEEILKNGIDSRYREMPCYVEDSVLVCASMLYNKDLELSCFDPPDPRAGFSLGLPDKKTMWYNIEFVCDPEDVHEEPEPEVVNPERGEGYYVHKIEPDQITDIFLVEGMCNNDGITTIFNITKVK